MSLHLDGLAVQPQSGGRGTQVHRQTEQAGEAGFVALVESRPALGEQDLGVLEIAESFEGEAQRHAERTRGAQRFEEVVVDARLAVVPGAQ